MSVPFSTCLRGARGAISALAAVLSIWAAAPAEAKPTRPAEVITDIAYAPAQPAGSRGHLLDLYLPEQRGRARVPLVIWSSGSAWKGDDGKSKAGPVVERFNARGYAVAGVSVRSSVQARFPAQVYDAKAAIRWLRANARRYGIDPNRFAMIGDSSGGWATTMAAVTGGVRELGGGVGVTGVSSRIQAAVAIFPAIDFLQMDAHMIDCPGFNAIFGLESCHSDPLSPESQLVGCTIRACPATVKRASPLRYVSRDDPPMLVMHGQADHLVPHHQSELLFGALQRACRDATFYSVPGADHNVPQVTAATPGSTVRTTERCRTDRRIGTGPSWETIERWVVRELRR